MTDMYSLPTLAALRNVLKMGAEEPAASFASRLAVANGVDSALTLCQQVLLKLDGLRQGDEKAIGVLAVLADITPEDSRARWPGSRDAGWSAPASTPTRRVELEVI